MLLLTAIKWHFVMARLPITDRLYSSVEGFRVSDWFTKQRLGESGGAAWWFGSRLVVIGVGLVLGTSGVSITHVGEKVLGIWYFVLWLEGGHGFSRLTHCVLIIIYCWRNGLGLDRS